MFAVFRKCLMCHRRNDRVWKDAPSKIVTTECQLSGLTNTDDWHWQNGESLRVPWRLIEERCPHNSEEQRSRDEKTEKKKKKSFYPSEPRERRRQNWYFISLLNPPSVCMDVCLEKAVLSSTLFMPRPQNTSCLWELIKFQFHHFFRLLHVLHWGWGRRANPPIRGSTFHWVLGWDWKAPTAGVLECAMSISMMSPRGLWGEVVKVINDSRSLSGSGPSRSNMNQQLKLIQTKQILILHVA